MYTESRTDRIPRSLTYKFWTGSYFSHNVNTVLTEPYGYVRSGTKVERFLSKIRASQDASSDYSVRRVLDIQYGFGHALVTNEDSWTQWSESILPREDQLWAGFPPAHDQSITAQGFYRNLENHITSFQALVAGGEAREAKRMICDRVRSLFSSVLAARRDLKRHLYSLRKAPARARARSISNHWLEIQFGWLPLISDIEAAQKAFTDIPDRYRRKISGVQKTTGTYSNLETSGFAYVNTHKLVQTRSMRVSRYCYLVLMEPDLHAHWGVSLRNIPGAVWELTPWSFLVDYFVNVDDWLRSITYASQRYVYGTHSTLSKSTCVVTPKFGPTSPTFRSSVNNHPGRATYVSYIRTRQTKMPSVGLSVNLAGATVGLREYNILALIGSRIKV